MVGGVGVMGLEYCVIGGVGVMGLVLCGWGSGSVGPYLSTV